MSRIERRLQAKAAKKGGRRINQHAVLAEELVRQGQFNEAISAFQKAVRKDRRYINGHYNLGVLYQNLGRIDEAATSYQHAISLKPDHFDSLNNLAVLLKKQDRLEEALACYLKTIAIKNDFFDGHNELGVLLKELRKPEEAVGHFLKAIAIKPDFALAHYNLGNTYKDLGQLDEAIICFRKALSINPDFSEAESNLLYTEQYRPGNDSQTLYRLHCEWDKHHGRKFRAEWPIHKNTPDPDRRIRIGFVSPDLGRHPVGYFLVRLFENLPSEDIETVVYSDRLEDDLSERIKVTTPHWKNVREISDADLSKLIGNDEVDILFDLSGHTGGNRLPVFARKPSPIQVSWAGYTGTTGLSAMDYLLSDSYSTEEDEEKFYSENIIRMPKGWLCYDPPDYAPKVASSPFKQNGYMTFGSFSLFPKINEDVVSSWARILNGVPNSRLLIKYGGIDIAVNTERLTTLFEAEGIERNRLLLEGSSPHKVLLERYNAVDIALDPFPYSGGLTTFEALWMGVPVITVPGKTFASRHAFSHLSTIGLPELVAKDHDDYVKLAVELGNEGSRVSNYRATLRGRMDASPVCNGEKFAEDFTALMREIWHAWCQSNRKA